MKATKRILDVVWTLEYELTQDGKMTIKNYTSEHEVGYEEETQLPRFSILEDDNRKVKGVYLQPFGPSTFVAQKEKSVYYEVVNPKHTFSYNGK